MIEDQGEKQLVALNRPDKKDDLHISDRDGEKDSTLGHTRT